MCCAFLVLVLKMGVRNFIFLALLLHAASSNPTVNPSSTTISSSSTSSSISSNTVGSSVIPSFTTLPSTSSSEFGFLSTKPSSSYEVTENVIDVPDDRTLSPVVPNFGIFKPLNVANTSISVNKVIKNDTGDENNQPKKTSFTYVHITKENEENKGGGITKLFRGIKDYVYNLKKGVVDRLHNYFHRNDKDKEVSVFGKNHKNNDLNRESGELYHEFHRSFDSDDNIDYEYDDHVFSHEHKDLKD